MSDWRQYFAIVRLDDALNVANRTWSLSSPVSLEVHEHRSVKEPAVRQGICFMFLQQDIQVGRRQVTPASECLRHVRPQRVGFVKRVDNRHPRAARTTTTYPKSKGTTQQDFKVSDCLCRCQPHTGGNSRYVPCRERFAVGGPYRGIREWKAWLPSARSNVSNAFSAFGGGHPYKPRLGVYHQRVRHVCASS